MCFNAYLQHVLVHAETCIQCCHGQNDREYQKHDGTEDTQTCIDPEVQVLLVDVVVSKQKQESAELFSYFYQLRSTHCRGEGKTG